MRKRMILSLLACSFVAVGYSQGLDKLGRPSWITNAKPLHTAAQTAQVEPNVQTARSAYFNVPSQFLASLPDLSAPPSPDKMVSLGGTDDTATPEQFPASASDAIVTATVTSQTPYLTQDHRQVYSELTFKPVSILKDATKTLAAERPAVILARGGTLQLPNGRTVFSVPNGGSNPVNLGTPYLLFLRYVPGAEAFLVSKVWLLSGAKPQELDSNGRVWNRTTPESEKFPVRMLF